MLDATRTNLSSLAKRFAIFAALAATALALVVAGPAAAQPKGNGGGSKSCPVEHEDGTVTYVPEGTQVGLFRCGSDGEWHFGWLVNARAAAPSKQGLTPVGVSAKEKRLARHALAQAR